MEGRREEDKESICNERDVEGQSDNEEECTFSVEWKEPIMLITTSFHC